MCLRVRDCYAILLDAGRFRDLNVERLLNITPVAGTDTENKLRCFLADIVAGVAESLAKFGEASGRFRVRRNLTV